MPEFKVGDRVICVSAGYNDYMTTGKEYEVLNTSGNWIGINSDTGGLGWTHPDKLKLVPEETKGPFFVVHRPGKSFSTLEEAEAYAKTQAANMGPQATPVLIVSAHKAFAKVAVQEVPIDA